MPIYEYRCQQCQKIFEYQQRMTEPAKSTCEECQGALERLISRSAFSFKGSGWYKDLYASSKPSTGSDSGGGSTGTSGGGDAGGGGGDSGGSSGSSGGGGDSGGGTSGAGSSSRAAAGPA